MSDLTASHCGCESRSQCDSNCGCNSIIWIIILFFLCGNNGGCMGGCGNGILGGCGNNDGMGCECIIIIILLLLCCGNNGGCC